MRCPHLPHGCPGASAGSRQSSAHLPAPRCPSIVLQGVQRGLTLASPTGVHMNGLGREPVVGVGPSTAPGGRLQPVTQRASWGCWGVGAPCCGAPGKQQVLVCALCHMGYASCRLLSQPLQPQPAHSWCPSVPGEPCWVRAALGGLRGSSMASALGMGLLRGWRSCLGARGGGLHGGEARPCPWLPGPGCCAEGWWGGGKHPWCCSLASCPNPRRPAATV